MELFKDILDAEGYEVYQAFNSEEAFTVLNVAKPDLILMDIQLPGMDGLTLTRLLKANENFKDIPIIAVTAHTMKGDREKALAAGCDSYVPKPIDIKLFLSVIEDFISKRKGAGDSGQGLEGSSEKGRSQI